MHLYFYICYSFHCYELCKKKSLYGKHNTYNRKKLHNSSSDFSVINCIASFASFMSMYATYYFTYIPVCSIFTVLSALVEYFIARTVVFKKFSFDKKKRINELYPLFAFAHRTIFLLSMHRYFYTQLLSHSTPADFNEVILWMKTQIPKS